MKHSKKLWLILAVIGLIALAFIACDNGNKPCLHDWQFTSTTATCEVPGEDTFTCKDCQATKKEARAKLDHNYSETWQKNETHHWKECACGDKIEEGTHEMDWVITTTVSEVDDGIETYSCTHNGCLHTAETPRIYAYATGTEGLAFTLIASNTAYRVARGTVTSGAVHIPAYRLLNDEYLPVTTVADDAFSNQMNITSVSFLENSLLETIGIGAFNSCKSLESIIIPSSVTSIGDGAFNSCSELKSVIFDSGSLLETIGYSAFRDCTSLESIIIPASVTSISGIAFQNSSNLASIMFESDSLLETIGMDAFRNCTSLESITIPASVTSVGNYAFRGWTVNQRINIPFNSLTPAGWDINWRRNCNANIYYNDTLLNP
jgi:hypothetical protein